MRPSTEQVLDTISKRYKFIFGFPVFQVIMPIFHGVSNADSVNWSDQNEFESRRDSLAAPGVYH
jgi:hypothetical protein